MKKKINVKNPFKIDQRKIFDSFKEIVEKLISLKDHEYTRTIRDEFKFIESFIQNEIKIRIPILGCYSSGKSLLLNNLIGYDILPVGKGIMTKIGIVINYTDSINKICLKKTFLTKSKNFLEEYQFFDDEKDFIYSKFENMKEILKLLNISYSYGDEFLDLIINFIKRFEEIALNASFQEISEKIEKSKAVLLLFTKDILKEEDSYVKKEYRMATEYFNKAVFVAVIDRIEKGSIPSWNVPWWMDVEARQYINLSDAKDVRVMADKICGALGKKDNTAYPATSASDALLKRKAETPVIKIDNGK